MARKVDSGGNRHSNAPGFGSGNGSGPKAVTFKVKRTIVQAFAKVKNRSY